MFGGSQPNLTRYVAYYRVSTAKQGRSGLGLEAQQIAVRGFLAGGIGGLVDEVVEVESGKRKDRPKIAEALRLCRLHGATLLIARINRLARNVAFVSGLMESGVDFVAVDMPSANRLTVHILAAVAEDEARTISENTKAALRAAKARGVKLGGDRGKLAGLAYIGAQASARVRSAAADSRARDLEPMLVSARASGSSLRAIGAELTRRGIPAPRGGSWGASQIARMLARWPS